MTTARRFAVIEPGFHNSALGLFTLDEILDAYPGTTWRFAQTGTEPWTITIQGETRMIAWAVERMEP
jgi:hypothetical protein